MDSILSGSFLRYAEEKEEEEEEATARVERPTQFNGATPASGAANCRVALARKQFTPTS